MLSGALKHTRMHSRGAPARTCGGVSTVAMPAVSNMKLLRTRRRNPSSGQALVRPSLTSSLEG